MNLPASNRSSQQAGSPASPNNAAKGTFARDFGASIVVFLVALPLCMGIAIASGVPIASGLVTGIVAGILVGALAGCPLQVSGPAAGLTVIVYEAVQHHGLKMLGLIVLLAGALQILAGLARVGQWFRAVSPAVVHGMLAGIGVLIFASQFHVMLDNSPSSKGVKNLMNIPAAVMGLVHTPTLPEKDIRGEVQSILKDLGDLHRRQINLNEEVSERIPNHYEALDPSHQLVLNDFSERQEGIISELKALQERGVAVMSHHPEKQQKVVKLGDASQESLAISLQAIQEDRGELALPAGVKAASSLTQFQSAFKNNEWAAAIGVMTILILVLWKFAAVGPLKSVPAPLIGVVAATAVAAFWQLPVLYVEIPSSIAEDLHFINSSMLQNVEWGAVLLSAAVIAVIASAETLLCATAVDSLQNGPRTNYNKELFSQGVGNMVCGFMGALPMTGVIVRSSANIQAGGMTRLSSVMHGVWLLVFVLFLSTLLRLIPTCTLAAILVFTGYKLVNFKEVKRLAKFGWSEVVIWLATVVVIVVEDLLLGVLTGLALSMIKLVVRLSRLDVKVSHDVENRQSTVVLAGNASFVGIPKLAKALESLPQKQKVIVETNQITSIDQAALELLQQWRQQYISMGGEVQGNWSRLEGLAVNRSETPDSKNRPMPKGGEKELVEALT